MHSLLNKVETFYWIGAVLSGKDDAYFTNGIKAQLDNNRIDWNIFLHLADKHMVLPSLYFAFKRRKLLEQLPEQIQYELSEIARLNTLRNVEILNQVESVSKLLNEVNIVPTFVKGCGNLLDGLYPNTGERYIGDIDLWVAPPDFLKAANHLQKAGYKSRSAYNAFAHDGMKHYPRLFHENYIADVEVHQFLANVPYHKIIVSKLNKDIYIVKTKELRYGLLTDENKALHNFVHSQLNDRAAFRLDPSLRQMYDFFLLSRKHNFSSTFQYLKRNRRKVLIYQNLVQKLFCETADNTSRQSVTSKIYKFGVDCSIKSVKLSKTLIIIDCYLASFRYYFYNLVRFIEEPDYRKKHWYRLIRSNNSK